MKLTPIEKRAARKARNQSGLDMNLVALIDIFTILIFFLMSSTGVEILSTAQAIKLPESTAEKMPR
ncbi:MAG: biopolymer transporter ExbD, partial [Piscinibacter sp.]